MASTTIKDMFGITPTAIDGNGFPTNSYVNFDATYTSLVYTRNMVVFQFNMTTKQQIPAYELFMQLPNGVAPKTSLAVPIYRAGSFLGTMRIQNNGYLRPEMAIASGVTFEGCVCFIPY